MYLDLSMPSSQLFLPALCTKADVEESAATLAVMDFTLFLVFALIDEVRKTPRPSCAWDRGLGELKFLYPDRL